MLRGVRPPSFPASPILRIPILAIPILVACGAAPAPAPHPVRDREARGDDHAAARAARSDRDLDREATFADLVTAARRQDDRRDQDAAAACLVRASASGYRLEADLAVAVRPLPAPPAELDARMEAERGPIRVLTRFGTYGAEHAQSGLVAINTTLPPSRGVALAFVLTDRGLYARRSDAPGGERDASRPEWILARVPWTEIDLLAITAEAAVPIASLVELLAAIPTSMAGRVTLAVVLEEGTRLPEPAAIDPGEGAELCPQGLPELAESDPLGDLPADRIRDALGPLRTGAELCVGTSTGPGASGGRVSMAVRIGPEGRVSDACVIEDTSGDPQLRACLARAARELSFDPPGGYLDFTLPLALEPGRAQRQAPLCRGSG